MLCDFLFPPWQILTVLALKGAASELQKVIDQYIKFANSSDEAYAHIAAEVRAVQ